MILFLFNVYAIKHWPIVTIIVICTYNTPLHYTTTDDTEYENNCHNLAFFMSVS